MDGRETRETFVTWFSCKTKLRDSPPRSFLFSQKMRQLRLPVQHPSQRCYLLHQYKETKRRQIKITPNHPGFDTETELHTIPPIACLPWGLQFLFSSKGSADAERSRAKKQDLMDSTDSPNHFTLAVMNAAHFTSRWSTHEHRHFPAHRTSYTR